MSEKDPTTEEIEPFPLDLPPVEKRGGINRDQEPKIEKELSTKEEIDEKLRGALRELNGIMDEGIIRVSLQSLDSRIAKAEEVIRDALKLVEKLD